MGSIGWRLISEEKMKDYIHLDDAIFDYKKNDVLIKTDMNGNMESFPYDLLDKLYHRSDFICHQIKRFWTDLKIVKLSYEDLTDVLCVYFEHSRPKTIKSSIHDNHLILEYDENNYIVGFELHGAKTIKFEFWQLHPERNNIPKQILFKMDKWLEERK